MDDIAKVFSAVSVILFFLGMGFNYFRTKYQEVMGMKPEKDKELRQKEYLKGRKEALRTGSILLLLMTVFFYILLPTAIRVAVTSNLNLWKFSLVNTIYFFIWFLVGILFIVTAVLTFSLWRMPRKKWPWLFKK